MTQSKTANRWIFPLMMAAAFGLLLTSLGADHVLDIPNVRFLFIGMAFGVILASLVYHFAASSKQ